MFNQVDVIAGLQPSHYLKGPFAALGVATASIAGQRGGGGRGTRGDFGLVNGVAPTDSAFAAVGQQESDSASSRAGHR